MKTRWKRFEPGEGAAPPDPQGIERVAVGLLARREHSRVELEQKLRSRGFSSTDVEAVLDRLAEQRLQSDERFAGSYARMRRGRGYGPERIRAELRERGVAVELVEQELAALADTDTPDIDAVWRRKFAGRLPVDYRDRARQIRFLLHRGFSNSEIHALFGRIPSEPD